MKYVQPLTLFQHLLRKRKSGKQAGLLGLDVGDRYVGLAMSDPSYRIATPVGVLQRTKTNIDLMASDFQCLIAKFSLVGFVVGCPFDRIQETPDGVPIKMFLDNLSRTGKFQDLKFTYWNECFTSKNVHLLIKPLDLHPVDEKTILDKVAAAGILQAYLDHVNKKMKLEAPK